MLEAGHDINNDALAARSLAGESQLPSMEETVLKGQSLLIINYGVPGIVLYLNHMYLNHMPSRSVRHWWPYTCTRPLAKYIPYSVPLGAFAWASHEGSSDTVR